MGHAVQINVMKLYRLPPGNPITSNLTVRLGAYILFHWLCFYVYGIAGSELVVWSQINLEASVL